MLNLEIIITFSSTIMNTHFLKVSLVLIFNFVFALSADEKQVYVVYLGDQNGRRSRQQIEGDHLAYLQAVKGSVEEAKSSIIYDYTKAIDGFAAVLSPDEASKISEMDGVITVFKDEPQEPQTSRSWEFTSLLESDWNSAQADGLDGLLQKANYGTNVIVGVVDSGIWPESLSFSDVGMAPVPSSWRGVCQQGVEFTTSHCNRKIVGARYYTRGYEQQYGTVNPTADFRSARDRTGHGTHVSGIIGGRQVANASSVGNYGLGTIRGGAPLVRLAVYKVCWHNPPGSDMTDACMSSDIIAAFDDAIGDGVHVISASIGYPTSVPFPSDPNAIASLQAIKNNIVVSFSAGNAGPSRGTVSNTIPWVITVGASSIDRVFPSPLMLGNGIQVQGQSITPFIGGRAELVYAGDIENPGTTTAATTGRCSSGTLSPTLARGKAVFCMVDGANPAQEVERAGGIAVVLQNRFHGIGVVLNANRIPATTIFTNETNIILNYIRTSQTPTVTFYTPTTLTGATPAPFIAPFSSRGPAGVEPNILKPDVIAPGLNILAASSEANSPNDRFLFKSGTSMSCPHVSGVIALLKAIHPSWSHSAIRSAIMTTAKDTNNLRNRITDELLNNATPFEYGSGHIQPSKAADPGLVYDNVYTDYLLFLCASIGQTLDPSYICPTTPVPPASNLNYPSLAIANVQGSATIQRQVTNVGNGSSTYTVWINNPTGYQVQIWPATLHFTTAGQTQAFVIIVRVLSSAQANAYAIGSYTWSDGVHEVKSPIVVSTRNSLAASFDAAGVDLRSTS